MSHQVIKYRLNADGTVPSFLCLHPEGVGGVFAVGDPNTPSPRDMVMVGLTEDGVTEGDFEVVPTKADLVAYLTEVGKDWTQPDPNNPNDPSATIPFDPVAAADWVWNRLDALNG
jgi:hypothetical protein